MIKLKNLIIESLKEEGLSFSDYYDESIPYDVKPIPCLKPMEEIGDSRNPDLMDDPLKPGNVFIFHGTRAAKDIYIGGIIAQVAGVINKDIGKKVFASHNPQTAKWKTDYEEDLKRSRGIDFSKRGDRFIVIASIPKNDVEINNRNGDLIVHRDVKKEELVAIYPDKQDGKGGFTGIAYYINPVYGDFANKTWTHIYLPQKRIKEEDIPVQNRSRWPRIDEKEIINETHLQDLYHATGIKNLLGILEDNSIKLTFAGGSTADMSLNKKYPFFLSTMRQKFGAYARGSSSSGGQGKGYISYNVIIHLDGTKLSSAGYKIFPVDYWDMGREHSEQEERIVSDKDEIKPLNTYIKDIHIFVDTEIANNFILGYFHQVNELSKKYSFPVYFYSKENEKYFRSHRIEGAVRDLNQLNFPKPNYSEDDLEYLKRSKGWTRNKDRSYITALINVYYDREPENKDQEYWKEHLIRSLKYYSYETASCVMADIHNSKGEHPEEFREIVKIMKKEGVHTIRDLINKLIERYKNK